jgi:hypothetical protein
MDAKLPAKMQLWKQMRSQIFLTKKRFHKFAKTPGFTVALIAREHELFLLTTSFSLLGRAA